MKKIILLIVTSLVANLGFAQPHPNWRNYTYNRMVTGIDLHGGNVWISTQGGLVKYNKKTRKITQYNRASANLPDNNLLDVHCVDNGDIWVACINNGIGKLTNGNCSIFNALNSGLPSNTNSKIKIDDNGDLWVASFRYMTRYNGKNWEQLRTGNILSSIPVIADFDIAANGTVWTYCTDGIGKIENDEYIIVSKIGERKTLAEGCVKVDGEGNIWFAIKDEGIYKYNGETFTNYNTDNSCLPSNTIGSVSIDRDNNMWLKTSDSLIKFGENNCGAVAFPTSGSTIIRCDNEGGIWCGAWHGQLHYYDGTDFSTIDISNSELLSNRSYPLFTDSENNVWIGTNNNTIKASLSGSEEVFDKEVKCGAQDSNGTIWMAFNEGDTCLLKINGNESTVFDSINSPFDTYIRSDKSITHIHADNSNQVWISTKGNGLYKYDGENFVNYTSENSQLPSNTVNQVISDNKNNLWGGTSNGLFKFDGSNWTIWNAENSVLPNAGITQLFFDSEITLWFSVDSKGLMRFNGQFFEFYNIDDLGFRNNVVSGIAEESGKLWLVGDGGGLVSFDKVDKWESYTISNSGITGNRAKGIIKDNDGNLWIGNWDAGISVFNPDSAIQTMDVTGINYFDNVNEGLVIYPNPVKNELFVKSNFTDEKITKAGIYDLNGRLMQIIPEESFNTKSAIYNFQVQPGLPGQIFVLSLKMENGDVHNSKFIISKQ